MQKNYFLFIIAGILAVAALVLYVAGGKTSANLPLQNGNIVFVTEAPEKTEAVVTATPIPTATPKPLPSATPTPIPTATPVLEQDLEDTFPDDGAENSLDSMQTDREPYRIFAGDERLRLLSAYSYSDQDLWLCQSSADADWLLETACPAITEKITEGSTVILSLGIADLDRAGDYAAIINTYAPTWKEKGCKVYFASLGPVESSYYISNERIMEFNTVIYDTTSCGFVDVYNYLASGSFSTSDGVNYDRTTSRSIYDYIVSNIQ